MKTKADRWNWAFATGALMAIYFTIVGNRPSSLGFFVFLIILSVCVCLAVSGLYSLIVHTSTPIIGTVIGTMLSIPIVVLSEIIGMFFITIFVTTPLYKIAPDILKIPLFYEYLVPLGLLIVALLKRPKEKKEKSQSARRDP